VAVLDWERVLREHHVPYADRGPNVKRGELAIQCPFCGSADPSKHMGLNLETGWWSCWRNRSQHSGKSPLRLIMQLLRVSYHRAREIAGLGADYIDPEGFDAVAARFMGRTTTTQARPEEVERQILQLPEPDVARQYDESARLGRHRGYLISRGFPKSDLPQLCKTYGLRFGVAGAWADRILIPYYLDRKLVTWTARAIGNAVIRYKDLALDDSILSPKQTLYNIDNARQRQRVLVLQEGPVDVLKVDFYGRTFGVSSVGLSTNSIKPDQAFLLQDLAHQYDRCLVMLDNATQLGIVDSLRMKQQLAFMGAVETTRVPFGRKDGGELTPDEVLRWCHKLTQANNT
jgi:hypothetical protein